MAATERDASAQSATADREIVIARVISAPRELVFEAFTEVRHLSRWWGPEGFTTTTRSFEFRVGGEWDCATRRSRSTTRSRAAGRP
jgi:uncharacterized protein YndB with AHSA1/START domain